MYVFEMKEKTPFPFFCFFWFGKLSDIGGFFMRIRNKKADKARFKRTANSTKALNIPGKMVARGGVRL